MSKNHSGKRYDDVLDAMAALIMAGHVNNVMYMQRMKDSVNDLTKRIRKREEVESQAKWLSWIKSHDLTIASGGFNSSNFERENDGVNDDKLYRVVTQGGRVEVMCFGVDLLDPQAEGEYDSVDDLPKWVQDRLAVLMIMSAKPPTVEVEGIGRRIDENTFWLYAD